MTSWHIDKEGRWGPAGSPNGVWPYDPKPMNEDAHEESPQTPLFGPTPDATNAAKITAAGLSTVRTVRQSDVRYRAMYPDIKQTQVYYPRSMPTTSSTTSTAMTTTTVSAPLLLLNAGCTFFVWGGFQHVAFESCRGAAPRRARAPPAPAATASRTWTVWAAPAGASTRTTTPRATTASSLPAPAP